MDKLANLILKSPVNAAIAVVICSLIPGLFVASLIILGLVTLRKGAIAGLSIAMIISALLISMYFYLLSSWLLAISMAAILVLPIWLLAIILRETVSLEKTILAAAGIVLTIAIVVLMSNGWATQGFYDLWGCQVGLNGAAMSSQEQAFLNLMSEIAPLWPVSMFLQYVSLIFIARWWQARAFNPGGFQKEFHYLRFDKVITSLAAIMIIVSLTIGSNAVRSLGLVALALLSIHGISIIHWYSAKKNLKGWLLVPLYIVLIIAGWVLIPVLVVLSLIDSFHTLRK
jgi:hypothetical protein